MIGTDADALDLSQLRFTFVARRGNLQTPNTLRLKVYNPSPTTVSKTMKEFKRVVLSAGYEGNFGSIFDGTVKQVRFIRESPTDTYLDIAAADGDGAYNFSIIRQTMAAGSTFSEHVGAIGNAMASRGISLGVMTTLPSTVFPRGKVMFGLARDQLRGTARSVGSDWYIDNGRLNVVAQTAYLPGDVPEINYRTGMIGMPTQTIGGIELTMLLNPSIRIGQAIKLNNDSIQRYEQTAASDKAGADAEKSHTGINSDGMYKVTQAEHTGDSRGNDWHSKVIAVDIDETMKPVAAKP
ncbi:hypothetical protein SAMN05216551_10744 [Chitinasiproducens palmae]|uniref:Bacteriophage protein n=2 Tax=Chitinasiproducens palmae TaxID=1770053 RepID=A0A1H2PQQ8_9BURK|nr:hypothetical protein [Chitinasiproducens palmae]SDV49074.1 hypothetical protein SAMN05216551_10744 [Chitinasiproducens palmae]